MRIFIGSFILELFLLELYAIELFLSSMAKKGGGRILPRPPLPAYFSHSSELRLTPLDVRIPHQKHRGRAQQKPLSGLGNAGHGQRISSHGIAHTLHLTVETVTGL